jgi:membrane protease YdiL (CAAX protease family)
MTLDAAIPAASRKFKPAASAGHLVVFLLINAAIAAGGFIMHALSGTGAAPAASSASSGARPNIIPFLLLSIAIDWLLVWHVYGGLKDSGVPLLSLVGGRWKSARDVFRDFGIALPFWIVWEATALGVYRILSMLRPAASGASGFTPAHSFLEVAVYFVVCFSAGFCEELVYRGYLQTQLEAFTGSRAVAIVGQGLVFGFLHTYQGWRPVIVISTLGVLYGLLATWRKSLLPGMVAHTWSDIYEGYLKFFWLAHG